jgi:hypothetical protein
MEGAYGKRRINSSDSLAWKTVFDLGGGAGDFAGHERLAVALAIVDSDVVREHFGAGVRAAGVKSRVLVLPRRHGAEHLAGGGLVETAPDPRFADAFQEAQCSVGRHIGGVLRNVKAHPSVALRGEVVNLVRTEIVQEFSKAAGIGHVGEVQPKAVAVLVSRSVLQLLDRRFRPWTSTHSGGGIRRDMSHPGP